MHWGCIGDASEMHLGCIDGVLEMHWRCIEDALGMHWGWIDGVFEMHKVCIEDALRMHFGCIEDALGFIFLRIKCLYMNQVAFWVLLQIL